MYIHIYNLLSPFGLVHVHVSRETYKGVPPWGKLILPLSTAIDHP